MTYSLTWDLDTLFPGGIHSPALQAKITWIKTTTATTGDLLDRWDVTSDAPAFQQFKKLITQLQKVAAGLDQASLFVTAIGSADIANPAVAPLTNQLQTLDTQLQAVSDKLKKVLVQVPDDQFTQLCAQPQLKPIAFTLTEMRDAGKELLDDKTEALIGQLNLDGKAAWSAHYDSLVATVNVPFHRPDGTPVTLSAGQADNTLLGHADAQYRADLLPAWEQAWTDKEQLFARHVEPFSWISADRIPSSRCPRFHACSAQGQPDECRYTQVYLAGRGRQQAGPAQLLGSQGSSVG